MWQAKRRLISSSSIVSQKVPHCISIMKSPHGGPGKTKFIKKMLQYALSWMKRDLFWKISESLKSYENSQFFWDFFGFLLAFFL